MPGAFVVDPVLQLGILWSSCLVLVLKGDVARRSYWEMRQFATRSASTVECRLSLSDVQTC